MIEFLNGGVAGVRLSVVMRNGSEASSTICPYPLRRSLVKTATGIVKRGCVAPGTHSERVFKPGETLRFWLVRDSQGAGLGKMRGLLSAIPLLRCERFFVSRPLAYRVQGTDTVGKPIRGHG